MSNSTSSSTKFVFAAANVRTPTIANAQIPSNGCTRRAVLVKGTGTRHLPTCTTRRCSFSKRRSAPGGRFVQSESLRPPRHDSLRSGDFRRSYRTTGGPTGRSPRWSIPDMFPVSARAKWGNSPQRGSASERPAWRVRLRLAGHSVGLPSLRPGDALWNAPETARACNDRDQGDKRQGGCDEQKRQLEVEDRWRRR